MKPNEIFTFNKETGAITGLTYEGKAATELNIPSTINGVAVTSIGYGAFIYCKSLTSVTIPESVTSIGASAFKCTSLESITIPSSVTVIGASAFAGCDALTSVTIPEGITSIGASAFNGCDALTSITIPSSVTSIGENAFNGCDALTSITIPSSVTSIGRCSFYKCTSLTSVTIPEGVTSIGEYAFYGCESLASINIPEGVTSIGEYAFRNCTSLQSVTIPSTVTIIGEDVFNGCTTLTSINIPEGVTSIGEDAFNGCTTLTSVTIPEGVTSIGEWAFSRCDSLTSVTILEGVTSIGANAFYGCKSLQSVTIPSTVTVIGEHAFEYCTSLTDIYYAGSKEDWNAINILDYNNSLLLSDIHCKKENKTMENKNTGTNLFSALSRNIIMHERIFNILMKMNEHQMNMASLNQLRDKVHNTIDHLAESKIITDTHISLFNEFISKYNEFKENTVGLHYNLTNILTDAANDPMEKTISDMINSLNETETGLFRAYDKLCDDLNKIMDIAKSSNPLVTVEADVFIIPNSVGTLSQFMADHVRNRIDNYANGIMEATGLEYDNKKEKFVECWFCNNVSDNFADHGIDIQINGKEYRIFPGTINHHLPVSIFEGHVEGDKVKVIIPDVECIINYDRKSKDKEITKVIDLEMILTLNQKSYRYRNYGTFDELLKSLCSR